MELTWVDASGAQWPLAEDNGLTLLVGTGGLDAPPVELQVDRRVGGEGGVLVAANRPTRPFTLVLDVLDESPDRRVRTLIGEMARRFQGPGKLRYTDETGTRELRNIYYEGGLEGEEPEVPYYRRVAVSLIALDPFWYGTPRSVPLSFAANATPWNAAEPWSAALPWNGGASTTVTVEGDAPALPFFDIYGPVSQVSIVLSSPLLVSPYGWQSNFALSAGQRLTIDHRWGTRGPKLQGSATTNWSLLTSASRLFTLPVGSSTIIAGLVGSTSATQAVMYWEPRWLTP